MYLHFYGSMFLPNMQKSCARPVRVARTAEGGRRLIRYPARVRDLFRMLTKDIWRALKRSRDCASGPDGIPAAAWRTGGIESAETLQEARWELLAGRGSAQGGNDALAVFIPKGVCNDEAPVFASPTRPLSFRSDSVKAIARATASNMK